METKEKCVACHTVETEDGLCDDCFTELPMNVWVTVTEKRYCTECGYDLADYALHETVCGACLSESEGK